MNIELFYRRLHSTKKDFITSEEFKSFCKSFNFTYTPTRQQFIKRGYIVRIFRDFFYLKSPDEIMLNQLHRTTFDLVSRGLMFKGIGHWYFGLYTALKLNNMTHEYYPMHYVISDGLFRNSPIEIAGEKFNFIKLKPALVTFGIERNRYPYSNPEKTILDFVYLWNYRSIPRKKILLDISEYLSRLNRAKLLRYSVGFPKSVQGIVRDAYGRR